MTDEQREALAALAVGETTVLVDRVEWPYPAPDGFEWDYHETTDGVEAGLIDLGVGEPLIEILLAPPRGKPGDVITKSVNLLPYRLRVESVVVKSLDEWVDPESLAISGVDVVRIGVRRWQRITQELHDDLGDRVLDAMLWLTTIKREG